MGKLEKRREERESWEMNRIFFLKKTREIKMNRSRDQITACSTHQNQV